MAYYKWKISQAEFQGFTRAKLEGIGEKLDDINAINNDQYSKINSNTVAIKVIKGRAALLGSLAGIIVSAIAFFAGMFRGGG